MSDILTLLKEHAENTSFDLPALFAADPDRFNHFSATFADLTLDYSRQRLTTETLDLLLKWAEEMELGKRIGSLFAGEPVNVSEKRPALHMALRQEGHTPFPSETFNVMPQVQAARTLAESLADDFKEQRMKGVSGQSLDTVLHLGVGGSDFGLRLLLGALHHHLLRPIHCVANVDGAELASVLPGLNARRTLVIVTSKSFTTQETHTNAETVLAWIMQHSQHAREEVLAHHFIAITANAQAACTWGVVPHHVVPLWDWVGGRYSLWGAAQLPMLLAADGEIFAELLCGAREMDVHFQQTPFRQNLPVLMGLVGAWNINFLNSRTQAILPYCQALQDLPDYLQQLEMESNGKRLTREGKPLTCDSVSVLWGGPGTLGQHSYFQFLHQGTPSTPCDFIVFARPTVPLPGHDDWLLAHALAQSELMVMGFDEQEAQRFLAARGLPRDLAPHLVLPGSRPSSLLLSHSLTAKNLGRLLALYEHKVFVQSVLWDINPFDQWAVEAGKDLARVMFARLGGMSEEGGISRGLLATIRGLRGKTL